MVCYQVSDKSGLLAMLAFRDRDTARTMLDQVMSLYFISKEEKFHIEEVIPK